MHKSISWMWLIPVQRSWRQQNFTKIQVSHDMYISIWEFYAKNHIAKVTFMRQIYRFLSCFYFMLLKLKCSYILITKMKTNIATNELFPSWYINHISSFSGKITSITAYIGYDIEFLGIIYSTTFHAIFSRESS